MTPYLLLANRPPASGGIPSFTESGAAVGQMEWGFSPSASPAMIAVPPQFVSRRSTAASARRLGICRSSMVTVVGLIFRGALAIYLNPESGRTSAPAPDAYSIARKGDIASVHLLAPTLVPQIPRRQIHSLRHLPDAVAIAARRSLAHLLLLQGPYSGKWVLAIGV